PQLSDTTYLSTRPAPPKPTLFPYTTLFRSHAQVLDAPEVPDAIKVQPGEKVLLRARASGVQIYVCGTGTDGKPEWTLKAPDAELDRKSTRLNSSHLVISYAVFCLKKKR